jgi:myxalamid-type nonribosomal peptide synthetase MxaA
MYEENGQKQIISYLTRRHEHIHSWTEENLKNDLRSHMKAHLPEYMVPAIFIFLSSLPVTPGGKLDRRRLPKPTIDYTRKLVKPSNPLEKEIHKIWLETLELDRIGVSENFFEIGGHSLLTVRLLSKLRERTGQTIQISDFFEHPTIIGMAQLLKAADTPDEINTKSKTEKKFINLATEAFLPEQIKAGELQFKPDRQVSNILLTGATGFVGPFLIAELIRQTSAKIYSLVRAENQEQGMQRIRNQMEEYNLWNESFRDRIIILPGDLSKPRLGLDTTLWSQLGEKIDSIYHNGAMVNHMMPYSELKGTNVRGTIEVLKLASINHLKLVNFVATKAVFNGSVKRTSINENTKIDKETHLKATGYPASKWVSEQLIRTAMDRKIPCIIHRLGTVTGHSLSGACNQDDHFYRFMRSCIKMGVYPGKVPDTDMTPVDQVAKAIISMGNKAEHKNRVFHIFNPKMFSVEEIMKNCPKPRGSYKKVTILEWIDMVIDREQSRTALPITPYLPAYEEMLRRQNKQNKEDSKPQDVTFNADTSIEYLEKEGIEFPDDEKKLIETYYNFLLKNGGLDS